MSGTVGYEVSAGVATVTLNHNERRNAFGQALVVPLLEALDRAVADDRVRVVVLTNAGTTFSAGADLKEDRSTLGPDAPSFFDVIDRIDASPKPVVGRIAGHAAGGGAAVVIACDIAVMVEGARLGITEVRLGIAPVAVAAALAHRIGFRALSEAFLTGDMLDASRAAALGLVNAAVPESELDPVVDRYVQSLVAAGPHALRVTKQVLAAMAGRPAEANATLAGEFVGDDALGAEQREGVAAFTGKRPPSWIPTTS